MENYAITVLNQTFIDDQAEPFFDVVTFLARLENEQSSDIKFLHDLATSLLTPNYENFENAIVSERVMKILDVYELIDEVTFEGNPEVNSRQIVPSQPMDLDQFIATFYSDYVFEDDMQG